MKGQMVFEFIVAAILLFGIIVYSLTLLNVNATQFRDDSYHNDLEIRAIQVAELLVHNRGDYTTPIAVGLSSNHPNISAANMNQLDILCSGVDGYIELLKSLNFLETPYLSGRPNYDFRILIENSTDVFVDCKDPAGGTTPRGRYVGHTNRFALGEDGSIISIQAWVW